MKRIIIATAFALGAVVSAHADTSTYYWQGKGGRPDEQLQAAARLCDQRSCPATCLAPLANDTAWAQKFSGRISESPIDCSTLAAANPRASPEAHPVRACA